MFEAPAFSPVWLALLSQFRQLRGSRPRTGWYFPRRISPSPNGAIDPVLYDDGSTGSATGVVDGDDVLLASFSQIITDGSTGGLFGFFQANYGPAPYQGSTVFMRAISRPTIEAGAQYAVAGPFTVGDLVFIPPFVLPQPDVINFPGGLVTLNQAIMTRPGPIVVTIHRAHILRFQTVAGGEYAHESSTDLMTFVPTGDTILGDGSVMEFVVETVLPAENYRVVPQ